MKPLLPALAEIRMEFWVMISVASTGLKTHRRTHTCMPIELITLAPTSGATWGNGGPHSGYRHLADKDEAGGSSPGRPTHRLTSENAGHRFRSPFAWRMTDQELLPDYRASSSGRSTAFISSAWEHPRFGNRSE
jgi:hypothetical protein